TRAFLSARVQPAQPPSVVASTTRHRVLKPSMTWGFVPNDAARGCAGAAAAHSAYAPTGANVGGASRQCLGRVPRALKLRGLGGGKGAAVVGETRSGTQ